MDYCQLCNGVSFETERCPSCNGTLNDEGKIYDYYDDYSPYLDIEWNKLADGDSESAKQPECCHLFVCPSCGEEREIKVYYGQ